MKPETLFSMLSEPTRLRAVSLIASEGELCVCELTHALGASQPKVSRHLALLREAGVVEARREGLWMHYRLSEALPAWAARMIDLAIGEAAEETGLSACLASLQEMPNRPEVRCGG